MAFVQITKVLNLGKAQYDQIMKSAYGNKPVPGETFHVAGPGKGVWYVVDGWRSREECDASMKMLMPALQAAGLSMDSMTVDEFEIHTFKTG